MPRLLNDDGKSSTIELDDGQTVVVPSGMSSLPLPAPMPTQGQQPAMAAMPAAVDATAQGVQAPPVADIAPALSGMAAPVADAAKVAPPPPPSFAGAYDAGQAGQAQELAGQRANIAADATQAAGEVDAMTRGQEMQDAANAERQKFVDERNELHQTKQTEADDYIKKAGEYKIDQNRAMDSMSTGKSVMFWIGAAMAGVGQALDHKSGPNPVLQMMDEKIQRDIALQGQERDALRQAGQDKYHALDRFDAFTTDKSSQLAMAAAEQWKRTQNEIAMQRSKTADKRAIANLQVLEGQAGQKSAAYAAAAAQGAADRTMQERQMKNTERATAISGGHLSLSNKQFEYGKQRDLMVFGLDQQKLDIEAQKLAGTGKVQQAKELREFGMMAPPKIKDGEAVVEPLRNKDGSTWLAPDAETRRKLATKMGATQDFIGQSDELRSLVKGEGAFMKYSSNERYEKAKVLIGNMQVSAKKRMEMGAALSGSELDMMNSAIGMVKDPLSFRAFGNNTAALEQGRKLTIDQLNTAMRYEGGYNGERIDIPDTFRTAVKTQADAALGDTVLSKADKKDVADNVRIFKAHGGEDPKYWNRPVTEAYVNLSYAQRQGVENLVSLAKSGDANATTQLDQLQTHSVGHLADYARELSSTPSDGTPTRNGGYNGTENLLKNFTTPVPSSGPPPTISKR